MEVTLTDDQEFFRETTRRFLATECPLSAVRALESDDDGFERDYWLQGAELGWTSLLVPEEQGGGTISGAGAVDLTIVADAFGRHVAPGPLLGTNVVASTIAASGHRRPARSGRGRNPRRRAGRRVVRKRIRARCARAQRRAGGIADRRRLRDLGDRRAGRGRRPGRPAPRHSQVRRRPRAVPRASRRRGCDHRGPCAASTSFGASLGSSSTAC